MGKKAISAIQTLTAAKTRITALANGEIGAESIQGLPGEVGDIVRMIMKDSITLGERSGERIQRSQEAHEDHERGKAAPRGSPLQGGVTSTQKDSAADQKDTPRENGFRATYDKNTEADRGAVPFPPTTNNSQHRGPDISPPRL